MEATTKANLIHAAALSLMIGTPLTATLVQFPIFIDRGSTETVSGIFVLLAALSCVPFFRQIKAYMKSPASWVVWLVLTVLLVGLRSIINQMLIVCAIGTLSNLAGGALYKIGDRFGDRVRTPDNVTDDQVEK